MFPKNYFFRKEWKSMSDDLKTSEKIFPIKLKPIIGAKNSKAITRLREVVLETFVEKLKETEEDLLRIVLFGSVARGDSEIESDLDVFILLREGDGMELQERIVNIAVDIDLDVGDCKTHISPMIYTKEEYEDRIRFGIPVFKFIAEEGIVLYDAEEE
jgi:predicted nucleotidyltransferase